MLQSYPVILTPDENGTVIAQFPDVPEAITVGADEANAFEWAQDALVVALTGYIEERRDIPPHVEKQVAAVTAFFKASANKRTFLRKFSRAFPDGPQQENMFPDIEDVPIK